MTSAVCKTFFFLVLIWIALPCVGQFSFSPGFKEKNPQVFATSQAFSKLPQLKGASFGLVVRNIGSGKTLIKHQENLNLIPASNQKLITSLNGLHHLGSEFVFKTHILSNGILENGILKGDLLLEGNGDPCIYSPDREKFGVNFFTKLIRELKERGIKKIEGKLKAMPLENPYQGIRNDWGWADIGNYYGAGIYPININENQYRLFVSAQKEGKEAKVKKSDSLTDVSIVDQELNTDAPGTPDLAYIYWIPGTQNARIAGSLPKDTDLQKVKGAIQNPENLFFKVLSGELAKAGIEVGNGNSGLEKPHLLFSVSSPMLKEIVKEVNLFSNNLMTESIAYALCKKEDKLDENGWTQLDRFGKAIGIPAGYYFTDGSGLSLSNRISPEGLCKALIWAKRQSFFSDFKASLPVSGESGTMKKFCNSPEAKGKIQAKSGTLTRTFCYSGYVQASGGELAFSIMINNYTGNFKTMKAELGKWIESLVKIK